MRDLLTKLFWPVLAPFEKGGDSTGYRPSHRKVLIGMGFMFLVLAAVSGYFALIADVLGGLVPVVVFSGVGIMSWVVGFLGSDAAVARIWGNG